MTESTQSMCLNSSASSLVETRAVPKSDIPTWHAGFLQLLPAIQKQARIAFRRLKKEAREEAVAEAVASAMVAYVRLVEIGKADVAYATPLAAYAVSQYWDGRKVAASLNIRDIMSAYCQRRKGVVVERLDHWDEEEHCWREVLVEDKTCTPAELAAMRIDFEEWLQTLTERNRRIALALGSGEATSAVAERFGLSWARISQLRRELYQAWVEFHEGTRECAEVNVAA